MLKIDAQIADEYMMRHCFALAAKSADQGEYPYAAVIVRDGTIVAETTNRVAHEHDITRHAETVAISLAQEALASTDLSDCTIYANVEPCAFCCYAIRESRVGKVVFAVRSPVMGGLSRWNILGDRRLSDTMPEVFAPPPVLVADFLCDEGDRSLRQSAPTVWAFMHARGLLGPAPPAGNDSETAASATGYVRVTGWIMRALRRNIFDRFGRRGGGRRQPRNGDDVTPFP